MVEGIASMMGRLQSADKSKSGEFVGKGKKPTRWCRLGKRWVLWTRTWEIQSYIEKLEKK